MKYTFVESEVVTQPMISLPLHFEQPCGQKEGERETTRRAGAATRHLIQAPYPNAPFLQDGAYKTNRIFFFFPKKHENLFE